MSILNPRFIGDSVEPYRSSLGSVADRVSIGSWILETHVGPGLDLTFVGPYSSGSMTQLAIYRRRPSQ
jgi:hypothetical protein